VDVRRRLCLLLASWHYLIDCFDPWGASWVVAVGLPRVVGVCARSSHLLSLMAMVMLPNCGSPASMTAFRAFSRGGGTALFGTLVTLYVRGLCLSNYPFFSLPSVLPKLSDVSLWIAETDRYQGAAYS